MSAFSTAAFQWLLAQTAFRMLANPISLLCCYRITGCQGQILRLFEIVKPPPPILDGAVSVVLTPIKLLALNQ